MKGLQLLLLLCLLALITNVQASDQMAVSVVSQIGSWFSSIYEGFKDWIAVLFSPLTDFCLSCLMQAYCKWLVVALVSVLVAMSGYLVLVQQPESATVYLVEWAGLTEQHEMAALRFQAIAQRAVLLRRFKVAIGAYTRAGRRFLKAEKPALAAAVYDVLAQLHKRQGNIGAEAMAYKASGRAFRAAGRYGTAAIRFGIAAFAYEQMSRYRTAKRLYEVAADMFEANGQGKEAVETRQLAESM